MMRSMKLPCMLYHISTVLTAMNEVPSCCERVDSDSPNKFVSDKRQGSKEVQPCSPVGLTTQVVPCGEGGRVLPWIPVLA